MSKKSKNTYKIQPDKITSVDITVIHPTKGNTSTLTANIKYDDYFIPFTEVIYKTNSIGIDRLSVLLSELFQFIFTEDYIRNRKKYHSFINNEVKIPYGLELNKHTDTYYFQGGIGYNSYVKIADFLGFELKHIMYANKLNTEVLSLTPKNEIEF